jgi:sec-independent protein translocase protein TatB
MDFLGIGPLELIVVLIIAFIVVGPERLPELARSLGKTVGDLRALSQGLTSEWQREIDGLSQLDTGEGLQEALTKPFKEAQADLQHGLTAPLDTGEGVQETLTKPFKEAQADLEQALSPSSSSSTSPTDGAAKPAPQEASPPKKTDALDGDVDDNADT